MTDDDRLAIQLAAATYRYPAAREAQALERLGLTPTRFWQRVDHLLDQPEALAEMPTEVNRLRRLREARRAVRSGASR